MNGLNLAELREANVKRCNESHYQKAHKGLMGWNPADWALAISGEW